MGSREKTPKIMLRHSICGVLLTPWWRIRSIWGCSNELWLVWLPSGTLSFCNICFWTSTHWNQFFLLITKYPSAMKLVRISWHHFVRILPHIYKIIFMSRGEDEGLLKLLSQTNCWIIGLWNPCFLPFPRMWLWVVLSLKSRLLVALST